MVPVLSDELCLEPPRTIEELEDTDDDLRQSAFLTLKQYPLLSSEALGSFCRHSLAIPGPRRWIPAKVWEEPKPEPPPKPKPKAKPKACHVLQYVHPTYHAPAPPPRPLYEPFMAVGGVPAIEGAIIYATKSHWVARREEPGYRHHYALFRVELFERMVLAIFRAGWHKLNVGIYTRGNYSLQTLTHLLDPGYFWVHCRVPVLPEPEKTLI